MSVSLCAAEIRDERQAYGLRRLEDGASDRIGRRDEAGDRLPADDFAARRSPLLNEDTSEVAAAEIFEAVQVGNKHAIGGAEIAARAALLKHHCNPYFAALPGISGHKYHQSANGFGLFHTDARASSTALGSHGYEQVNEGMAA